jgi:hypothetical protein
MYLLSFFFILVGNFFEERIELLKTNKEIKNNLKLLGIILCKM